jgi:hypothetical protein
MPPTRRHQNWRCWPAQPGSPPRRAPPRPAAISTPCSTPTASTTASTAPPAGPSPASRRQPRRSRPCPQSRRCGTGGIKPLPPPDARPARTGPANWPPRSPGSRPAAAAATHRSTRSWPAGSPTTGNCSPSPRTPARPGQSQPDLMLAAVHYLLARQPGSPLARYYPPLTPASSAAPSAPRHARPPRSTPATPPRSCPPSSPPPRPARQSASCTLRSSPTWRRRTAPASSTRSSRSPPDGRSAGSARKPAPTLPDRACAWPAA